MNELPLRAFGPTGLMVTPVCIGAGPLGGMPHAFGYDVPAERGMATVRAFFDSPINFIDTAASYGDGESERRIGVVLAELGGSGPGGRLPRGKVLATKADRDLQNGEYSADQMRRSVERSMRLLGMDHFPLVYLHDPEHYSFEDAMRKGGPVEGLLQMQDEGLIDHLGVGGSPLDLLTKFVLTGAFQAVLTHNRFTLINRTAAPLLDLATERGMAVANGGVYGSGILAKGSRAFPRYHYHEAGPEIMEQVQQVEGLCAEYGVPLGAAALQFSMRDPRIHTSIVGISRPERVAQTVEWATRAIPEEFWARLDEITLGKPNMRQAKEP